MELRGWLMETYNERGGGDEEGENSEDEEERVERVKLCRACREIVTVVGLRAWAVAVEAYCADESFLRVNDASIWIAFVDCTTFVRGVCSGRRMPRSVLTVRRRGTASIMLVRRPQRVAKGRAREAHQEGRPYKQMVMRARMRAESTQGDMIGCQHHDL